jgi:hypothetical protein|nr:MAG TPA: Hint [Caudoviricetes sp.]
MNKIKAEIVAHSKRAGTGDEIITYKLTFPRIILSEVNTYKQIEKNTSSCLSGNSLVLVYDGESFKEIQIKKLFENSNQNLKIVSFNEDYSFLLQDISKVFHSGVKPVYRITFYSGYCLDCTENHRLLKSNEYNNEFVTLKDFNIKQENGNVLIDSKIMNTYFVGIDSVQRKGYSYKNLQVDNSGNIYVPGSYSDIKYLEYEIYEPMRITNIEYLGEMDTYDIEVDGEYHNFIANGVVVHNSRAIPFEKMLKVIEDDPFYPIAYQKCHKGMQGTEYFTDKSDIEHCKYMWSCAIESALAVAEDMYEHGVSKQIINRTVEPYTWITQLCTGTRESFEHLFEQRCPLYEVDYSTDNGLHFQNYQGKSRKEIIKYFKENNIFFTGENQNDLWWLQHNKGQAEIHFMDLAEKMYDALNESTPNILEEDCWHIPFAKEILNGKEFGFFADMIKKSVCLTAKISYTKIGDENSITSEKAQEMYERLKNSGHWSCFGHIAKCMTDEEYRSWIKGKIEREDYIVAIPQETHGYNKQLRGFISLRQYVEDNVELKDI